MKLLVYSILDDVSYDEKLIFFLNLMFISPKFQAIFKWDSPKFTKMKGAFLYFPALWLYQISNALQNVAKWLKT